MNFLRWNLTVLVLAILAGGLSFLTFDPEISRAAQVLFLILVALVTISLLVHSLCSSGHRRRRQ